MIELHVKETYNIIIKHFSFTLLSDNNKIQSVNNEIQEKLIENKNFYKKNLVKTKINKNKKF